MNAKQVDWMCNNKTSGTKRKADGKEAKNDEEEASGVVVREKKY